MSLQEPLLEKKSQVDFEVEDDASDLNEQDYAPNPVVPAVRKRTWSVADDFDKPEEYLQVRSMEGLRSTPLRTLAHYVLALVSCGLSILLSYWFPLAYLRRVRYLPCDMVEAEWVIVIGEQNGWELCQVEEFKEIASNYRSCNPGVPLSRSRPLSLVPLDQRMLVFRHARFFLDPQLSRFRRLPYLSHMTGRGINTLAKQGLNQKQVDEKAARYGHNSTQIPITPISTLLRRELLHPFFVFQVYSVILWCFENYFIFASAIALMALHSLWITVRETRKSLLSLAQIAKFQCDVTVLRGGQVKLVDSSSIIPGDVVYLSHGMTLPCDLALLQGSAVINEGMLTGESVPVVKVPVERQDTSEEVVLGADQRCTLFAGTRVVQLKPHASFPHVVAMAVRTGFGTTKGSLICSILYPKPSSFKFVQQSFKFVAAMFGLAMIGFGISVWKLLDLGAGTSKIVIRALDLITIVVPPSLPLAMAVGTNFAMNMLRQNDIFCTSPSRINMAGKVKWMCFDKTGTLTSDGMELMGIRPSNPERAAFEPIVKSSFGSVVKGPLLETMACCHSLADVEGDLVGDPLEVKVFVASDGHLVDKSVGDVLASVVMPNKQSLGIQHRFDFSSALQRMSVIASSSSSVSPSSSSASPSSPVSSSSCLYVKGSPEALKMLCRPNTIPDDFEHELAQYAQQGYRVLAMAYRPLSSSPLPAERKSSSSSSTNDSDSDNQDHEKDGEVCEISGADDGADDTTSAHALPGESPAEYRARLEQGLIFLGLALLENKLKPETAPALARLKEARVRSVVVTGDNPLTAITVAREAGLIDADTHIFQSRLVECGDEAYSQLEWVHSEDNSIRLNPRTLTLAGHHPHIRKFELAITGSAFAVLQNAHDCQRNHGLFHKIVLSCAVFARMTPDQKAALVAELQRLGMYVGMCGDGANDCAALKTAHIGVSLSDSEASIAAPFTYTRPNISCIPILLSEGRSSLVTSFQLFRFMAMYSMVQFIAVLLLYFKGTVYGDFHYLYQDLCLVFPLVLTMGYTQAERRLSVKRPSGDLLSLTNLFNLLVHVLIAVGFQMLVLELTSRQSGYQPSDDPEHGPEAWETTTMFYFSNFQLTILSLLFAMGRPWKQAVYSNLRLSAIFAFAMTFNACLLFVSSIDSIRNNIGFIFADDINVPMAWREELALLVLVNIACHAVWEVVAYPLILSLLRRSRNRHARPSIFGGGSHKRHAKPYHRMREDFEAGWPLHRMEGVEYHDISIDVDEEDSGELGWIEPSPRMLGKDREMRTQKPVSVTSKI